MKVHVIGFLSGLIFALGLGVSGMTQTEKILNFLDVFGSWDYSLAFVMIGAIIVHFIVYRWITHKDSPIFSNTFHMPTRKDIDKPLIFGAILFGIGWGVVGYCPGPALTSLAGGNPKTLVFVISMLVSMRGYTYLDSKRAVN